MDGSNKIETLTEIKNQVAHTTTHVEDPCSNLIVHVSPCVAVSLSLLVLVQFSGS